MADRKRKAWHQNSKKDLKKNNLEGKKECLSTAAFWASS